MPCAARLFDLVWETIADVIGTAATATLVRRSAKRLSDRGCDLGGVVITREGFDYRYSVPDGWQRPESDAVAALRELARELSPLLVELTGRVIIRRLDAVSDLQRCAIRFQEQEP
ncbi:MAG: hypothetical protein LC659_10830 [Myxococcales bacterium]|nr:hypothetical protein [Myxococcales bacterium]